MISHLNLIYSGDHHKHAWQTKMGAEFIPSEFWAKTECIVQVLQKKDFSTVVFCLKHHLGAYYLTIILIQAEMITARKIAHNISLKDANPS